MPHDDPTLQRPLTLRTPDGLFLPVQRAQFEVRVEGPHVTTEAHVTFHNETGRSVEADLVLPLPPFAVVQSLQARWGQRALDGIVQGKSAAKAAYKAAVAKGHAAALGEGEGEDFVRVRLSPIEADASVTVSLTLLHGATATMEGHRVVVPLTYMPRYVEDAATLTPTEVAALDRPRPVTLDARATVRFVVQGVTEAQVRCVSHATQTAALRAGVEVRVEAAALDRDVLLEVRDRPTGTAPVAIVRRNLGPGPDGLGPCGLVTVVPPAFADEGPTVPRTVLFLVDRSGSMGGRPMEAAKRAVRGSLRALGPDDRFNLIAFDDQLEALAPQTVPFTDETLRAADAFADSLDARGGTEASQAFQAVLRDKLPKMPTAWKGEISADTRTRLRQVVFMTDGDVAGAAGVLRAATEALGNTRVHVLGIGDAVNHALLGEIASLGGGTYTPVSTDEDLERALLHLKNALYAPVWMRVTASLLRGNTTVALNAQEPQGVWDLFAGTALTFAWRGFQQPGDVLQLAGVDAVGKPTTLAVALDDAADDPEAFARWATLRARRLTYRFDAADDAALEALGTAFRLITRRTSLVAVDPNDPGTRAEVTVAVSLPLPGNVAEEEMTRSGIMGGGGPRMFAPAMVPTSAMAPAPPAPPAASRGGSGSFVAKAMKKMKAMIAPSSADMDDDESDAPTPATMDFMEREEADALYAMPAAMAPPAPPPPMAQGAARARGGRAADGGHGMAPAPEPVDEAGALRALLLGQQADGMFGSVGDTLAAVAALVAHGHTHREGDYRAELKRTLATLRAKVASLAGHEAVWARLAVALLTVPHGIEPEGLDAGLAASVRAVVLTDAGSRRSAAVRATLGLVPSGWDASARAAETRRRLLPA